MRLQAIFFSMVLGATGSAPLFSQTNPAQPRGTVERIKVHGKSLEGNLEGDSPDRDVSVYLPASYSSDRNRRYPVIYLLHGYTDSDDRWFGRIQHFINVPALADKVFASGGAREMLIVMPNAYTAFKGSMYSSSATTGDWETYVAKELVDYIDSHYRTIANPGGRGLAGHSMGGYGTVKIAMQHAGVFSSLYILSPCCMTANLNPRNGEKAEAVHSMEEVAKADFATAAAFASAAAWSPNPNNPPFYIDLPTKDGKPQPEVIAKWAANAPLAMIDQYIPNLKTYHAIAMDAGAQDEPIASTVRTLDQVLTKYGIAHEFAIYEGNHVNHVADRVEGKMLPFFSKSLNFESGKH
jgi:S-formylglutathione hydrolase